MTQITYTCSACGQSFNDDGTLSDHMVTHHTTKTEVSEEGEVKY